MSVNPAKRFIMKSPCPKSSFLASREKRSTAKFASLEAAMKDFTEERILAIIRTQWPRRHTSNPEMRRQARNLIRAHIDWLRRVRESKLIAQSKNAA